MQLLSFAFRFAHQHPIHASLLVIAVLCLWLLYSNSASTIKVASTRKLPLGAQPCSPSCLFLSSLFFSCLIHTHTHTYTHLLLARCAAVLCLLFMCNCCNTFLAFPSHPLPISCPRPYVVVTSTHEQLLFPSLALSHTHTHTLSLSLSFLPFVPGFKLRVCV